MDDINEQFVLEDGRKAEKVVKENKIDEKESHKIIEIRAEEPRLLKIQKRVIEKMKSYMYERVTETLDQETGVVVDTKVETFDCLTGELRENTNNVKSKLNSLGAINEVNLEENNKINYKSIVLTVVIVAQIVGLAYLLFWK